MEYAASLTLNGTFSMPWDGDEYATAWLYYDLSNEVRIRLRESATTPGTWETILDVRDLGTLAIESTVIGSEVVECDPAGTPSGGGSGTVVNEPVDALIHECEPECFDPAFPMFVLVNFAEDSPYVEGTYALTFDGVRYSTSWTPVQAGGGGYQLRFRIEINPEEAATCGADTPWTLYGDAYNVVTEETFLALGPLICLDCSLQSCPFCADGLDVTFNWPDETAANTTFFA